ncbi:MAG: LysR family transcriptional regulator [Sphaerochaetaceae bacterium]|jgi:molybdate transport system regulatory protein|nr:LysR family transcriptional regulator [Sphaerochaetaceae bacterium]MDY0371828.1 LysR family transcriptional regulator [Sphaerochaetaceae bacterium]
MEIKTKLYLVTSEGEKFMGIGVLWLLERVNTTGSIRAAALSLGISYSKAFAMVKNLEEQLGLPVVDRRRGGANREGSVLTEFGRRFLILYDSFQNEAKQRLIEPFAKFTQECEQLLYEFTPLGEKERHCENRK